MIIINYMITIKGYTELNKNLWENRESDKIMMLYFGTSWCGPCKKLKEKIMSENEEIQDLLCLYIDCDEQENEEICEDWKVEALPTQIFVHLNDNDVVKDEKIEGYDWIKLVMSYNKIIENKSN
jgi:thioredoxin 1